VRRKKQRRFDLARQFSWHKEYYDRALKQISNTAGKQISFFMDEYDEPETSWLEWFEREYPEQYRKYQQSVQKVEMLWGDSSPKAMEEFKKAVKVEVDATKWAVEKWIADRMEMMQAERMKGTQEALVL
jgi:hypothetical protein